jgi:hypothetical protein
MSTVREDIRQRLTSELGDCCETDVDRRLAELRALRDRSRENVRRDSELFATLGDETRLRLARGLAAAEELFEALDRSREGGKQR